VDKTVPYDEPRDPFAALLNSGGPDVKTYLAINEQLEIKTYPREVALVKWQVPFLIRQTRAAEMESNLVRAISDGYSPGDLKEIIEKFRAFRDGWEMTLDRSKNRTKGGTVPKERDKLLSLYGQAWGLLMALSYKGFPLRDYANTRAGETPPRRPA
jgi:hypothetical protein